MSREEAIKVLKEYLALDKDIDNEYLEAQRVAIKAMEQEPCEDCISRAKAIKALEYSLSIESDGGLDNYRTLIKDLLNAIYNKQKKAIEDLPPATPTQKWIPVSERLPNPQEYGDEDYSDWVQITLHIGENHDVVGRGYYCFNKRKWYADRLGVGVVTAWMPLPQPYKTESEV